LAFFRVRVVFPILGITVLMARVVFEFFVVVDIATEAWGDCGGSSDCRRESRLQKKQQEARENWEKKNACRSHGLPPEWFG
jgi:hypothetical protein